MKSLLFVVLVALIVGKPVSADETKPNSTFMPKMRARVLALQADEIGVNKKVFPQEVWGVLMDTSFQDGDAYSLVVLADGSTIVYTSGASFIGAGQHTQVRNASTNFLTVANHYLSSAKAVTSYPLPPAGQVAFYFLSYGGVFSYSAPEEKLGDGKDKLSKLFYAAQQVIAEVRKIEKSRHKTSPK